MVCDFYACTAILDYGNHSTRMQKNASFSLAGSWEVFRILSFLKTGPSKRYTQYQRNLFMLRRAKGTGEVSESFAWCEPNGEKSTTTIFGVRFQSKENKKTRNMILYRCVPTHWGAEWSGAPGREPALTLRPRLHPSLRSKVSASLLYFRCGNSNLARTTRRLTQ